MFPRVIINKEKYRKNVKNLVTLAHDNGMSVMAVTKVFCADQYLVDVLEEENVDYIADSRIQNLESINTRIPKVLLRLPMLGEVRKVVLHSDISLNSELITVTKLNEVAIDLGLIHGVIVMVDLGDLREGIFDETELYNFVDNVISMSNIRLRGIGVNLTCYGGVIPTKDILSKLVKIKDNIEEKYNVTLDIVSGGNSSNIDLMLNGDIPEGVNNIRLGESLVLGRETAYGDFIDGTCDDVFLLEADIIEVKEKPSVPIGQIGMNAFGKIPVFEDKGNILRAILAIGKQDVEHTELIPFDTVKLIGSSSDHILVDISNSLNTYEVGDTMLFKLTYGSILSLMTSKYVSKHYE